MSHQQSDLDEYLQKLPCVKKSSGVQGNDSTVKERAGIPNDASDRSEASMEFSEGDQPGQMQDNIQPDISGRAPQQFNQVENDQTLQQRPTSYTGLTATPGRGLHIADKSEGMPHMANADSGYVPKLPGLAPTSKKSVFEQNLIRQHLINDIKNVNLYDMEQALAEAQWYPGMAKQYYHLLQAINEAKSPAFISVMADNLVAREGRYHFDENYPPILNQVAADAFVARVTSQTAPVDADVSMYDGVQVSDAHSQQQG